MKRKTFILTLMLLMLAGLSAWAQNVAKIGDTEYETFASALSAVKDGDVIYLLTNADASNVAFTPCNGKKVIITGTTGNEVLNMGDGDKGGIDNADITFLNLKMQIRHTLTGGIWYTEGMYHAKKIKYENVVFDGVISTYDDVDFLNCTFTSNPQNMEYTTWNYGGTQIFKGCKFEATSAGTKSFIKLYNQGAPASVAVVDCDFFNPNPLPSGWKNGDVYNSNPAIVAPNAKQLISGNKVNGTATDDIVKCSEGGANVNKFDSPEAMGITLPTPTVFVAKIGDVKYVTLKDAIAAVKDGETITMLKDVDNADGIIVPSGKNFTLDFGGHTYKVTDNLAGSTGTKNQCFQLLKGSELIFKNGRISTDCAKLGVNSYANLKLVDMTIDMSQTSATGQVACLETCNGSISLQGNTSLVAKEGQIAVLALYWPNGGYGDINVELNTTGEVKGLMAYGSYEVQDLSTVAQHSHVAIKNGKYDVTFDMDNLDNYDFKIYGGVFKTSPDTKYLAPNHEVVTNTDSETSASYPHKVQQKPYVAMIGENGYFSLADALVAVKNNETIVMHQNDVLTKGLTITLENNEAFTLDLNGKTVSIAETGFDFTANGTNNALRNGVPVRFAVVVNGVGSMTICDNSTGESGRLETKNNSYGTTKTILVDGNAVVNVNSGTIAADYAPFYVVGFTGTTAVPANAPKPTLNVNGGKIVGQEIGIGIKGNTATLKVTGGEIVGDNQMSISTNGTQDWYDGGKFAIEVTGGVIKSASGAAMYLPAEGPTVITGGTFEGGVAGIAIKGGTLSISGNAVVKATGSKKEDAHAAESGYSETGSCIYVEDTYANHAPIVNISGGKFSSVHNKAVEYYTTKADDAQDKGEVTVSGGTFSDLSGVNYVADGGTYKLANDVTMSGALDINSGKKFVVDLNGKTLTGRTNIKHGDVTFVNGTINGGDQQALNVYGSSESAKNYSVLTVANNVTVTADVFGVCLFGPEAGSNVGYGAVANINGTIEATKSESSNEGAVFVSGNLGNGESIENQAAMEGKNIVNITGSVTSASDAALALNGSATVTIAESASLTGNTAIAAKRGKLVVNGGTITGNGACVGNPTGNGNGTELTGSALSASSTYGKHLTIDVKGGEFTSAAYTILNNSDDDACTFNISGGSFKTTKDGDGIAVYARLGSVNITGGTFENSSNSEATLHVGCPTAKNNSKSPKLTITGAPVVTNNATGSYSYNVEWRPLTVNMANGLAYKAVEISGGEFHGQNPEKDDSWTESNTGFTTFLKAGYAVKGSDNVWTVVPENASPVIAKTEDVKITDEDGESLTEAEQTQVTTTLNDATDNMTNNTEISLVYEENNSSVANDVVGTDQSVGITVELTGTKVSVTTGSATTVSLKEFTFDVTPYVVETTTIGSEEKSVAVKKIENQDIKAPMTFRLPIPSSVTDSYARVYHKHDGKTTDLGLKEIQGTSPMRFIEISTTSFSEFAVKFTAETVTKPSTLYYYAGNSTKVDGTPENFKTAQTTSTNAIAFVDKAYANWASTQTNVVVKYPAGSNYYYECPNFVLTDKANFFTPVDFHVVNGSYTRTDTRGLNTVCLPFELSSTDVNNGNIGVFHSTDMYNGLNESGKVYFNIVESVASGTPCIIKCSGTDAGWNIDLAGKTVAANPNNVNALKGSYVKETIGAGVYKVDRNGEKFGKTTEENATVTAFRAYLDLTHGNGMDANVKELNIGWADDATGIENVKVASDSKVIYDLTGRMVNNPVKGGLYIVNGKKVIFK